MKKRCKNSGHLLKNSVMVSACCLVFVIIIAFWVRQCSRSHLFLNEERPGGVIFIDEAFYPALQAATNMNDLRSWAVDLMSRRNAGQFESEKHHLYEAVWEVVPEHSIPPYLATLHTTIPSVWFTYKDSPLGLSELCPENGPPKVTFHIDHDGNATCLSISWRFYGMYVGRESFILEWEPWYLRRIDDGIYLYYDYGGR